MLETHLKTILIIDDDQLFLDLLTYSLDKKQYNVIEARSGQDALASIARKKPDLILLDLSLPDINGLTIANLLKTSPYLCEIPIIVLTADNTSQTIEQAYSYNIHNYLIKPVNPVLLVKQIEMALNNNLVRLKLKKQSTQFDKVQQLAGIGTWEYDASKDQFRCSEEFYSILDIHEKIDVINLDRFLSYTHPDSRQELKQHIQNAIHHGQPYSFEHVLVNDLGFESLVLHSIAAEKSNTSYDYIVSGVVMDITERRNEQNLITHTRFYDIITGLPNRDNFCNRLNTLLHENSEGQKLLGLLFIGIDRFKSINETLGRHIGDELLVTLANQLDTYDNLELFRYTGDVFAAVITNMSTIIPAHKIAEDIHKKLQEPITIGEQELYLSVSIGMAFHPFINGDRDDLISCAESAMYQAKRMGSNRTRSFDKNSFKKTKKRLHIETDLRKALDKDEFEVFYQPQVAVENNNLVGMEALLRWKHPEYGIIKPDQFIPVAEDTGLIVPLGEWVLSTATAQCAKWYSEGYGMLRVAINISPRQFDHKNLVKTIQESLLASGLPACTLDLEITESSAMKDINHTQNVLAQFSELGVQTSMDDFGTGYSSLNYIRELPLQTIKIDKAFIQDIKTGSENTELAEIIINMCKSFGRNIIAEGVENIEHLNFLRNHHCNEAQGYFFSPPLKNTHFELLFNSSNSKTINYKPTQCDKLDTA